MKTEIVAGEERLILNPMRDACPLCETLLSEVAWGWRMFHGEAEGTCCGVICQIKSYHVDESKQEQRAFAESLDDPERIELNISKEWIEPLNKAMKELDIKDISSGEVQNRAKELKELLATPLNL